AEIKEDQMQPMPGQSTLDQASGDWIITLNMNREAADRGFVVAHEVKHILDHGFGAVLYRPVDVMTAHQRNEHVADYFAACLIMPRLWVERYCRRGVRSVEELANCFSVSPARMWLRLEALELAEGGSERPPQD